MTIAPSETVRALHAAPTGPASTGATQSGATQSGATQSGAAQRGATPSPPPFDLEFTSDTLGGAYGSVRSWVHLEALAAEVEAHAGGFLVVQRRDDPGQRFAQCSASGAHLVIDLGALDARSKRHSVWRVHQPHERAVGLTAQHFSRIARDWLSIGVVPGYTAIAVPLTGDDEPF